MKIAARFLLSFVVVLFTLLVFNGKVHASSPQNPNQQVVKTAQLNTDQNVPLNLHNFAQIVLLESMSAMVCQLTGYDPISSDHKCLGVDSKTGKIGFVSEGGGMIAVMGRMIDATFVPPVSSGQYIAYMQSKFGIAKHAYAQVDPCDNSYPRGFGFCGLQPVIGLWIVMRNIVYLIMILVFVVIGIGIMLRIHIDPRTVMTIQNQIPKIIMGIVFITFSFAIAGFLIDVMYVALYLFASVITSASTGTINTDVVLAANPFDAANASFQGGILSVAGQASSAFAEIVKSIFDNQTQNFGGNLVMDIFAGIIGAIINVIGFLIIAIAIIVALVRLWVSLIITYVNIILDVVFAPFWILTGLLPGSPLGVGAWFRDLIANLAVFPVAIGFFLLANVFLGAFTSGSNRFVPPLIGGVNPQATAAIIGLGFILMLPNVLSTVKTALKAPKLNFGPILGPVAVGGAVIKGIPGTTFRTMERTRYAAEGEGALDRVQRMFGNPLYRRGNPQGGPKTHGPQGEGTGGKKAE